MFLNLYTLKISFFFIILFTLNIREARAQSFPWLNGGTGYSIGSGTTVDELGRGYVVGTFENKSTDAFALPSGIVPAATFDGNFTAYLSRYDLNTGQPDRFARIRARHNPGADPNCSPAEDPSAFADRVAIASTGDIYVLGVFTGCDLELYDNSENLILTTNSSYSTNDSQKVFIAIYDSTFRPVACHILTTDFNIDSLYSADIKRG